MNRPPPSLRTIMQHRAAARHNHSMLWASLGLGAMVAWWAIVLPSGLYQRFTLVGWMLSPGLTLYALWILFRGGRAVLSPAVPESREHEASEAELADAIAENEGSLSRIDRVLEWILDGSLGLAPAFAAVLSGVTLLMVLMGVLFVLSSEPQPFHFLLKTLDEILEGKHPFVWAFVTVGVGMPAFALGMGGLYWVHGRLWERALGRASPRWKGWITLAREEAGLALLCSTSCVFLIALPCYLLALLGVDSIGVVMLWVFSLGFALLGLGWGVLRLAYGAVRRGLKRG